MGLLVCCWTVCLLMLVLHIGLISGAASLSASATLDVLLAFRKAITADPTQALVSWTNTTNSRSSLGPLNYCSWEGVVCHPNTQQLKGISLPERQLEGRITPMLGQLAQLSYLNLSFNQLSGSVPAELGSCTTLLELSLNDNHLDGAFPAELTNLTRLQVLSAGSNALTGVLPQLVLPALQVLNLTTNSLQGSLMSLLPGCSHLRILHLSSNHFEGPIPDTIGNLSRLEYLELAANNFTSISPFIANCTRLQHFNVWSNRIVGVVPADWFSGFSGLSFLTLGVNQFTGTLPTNIGTLSKLQNLVLLQNKFQGQLLHSLLNCSSLTIIDVSGNNFTESIPAQLGSSLSLLAQLTLETNHFYGAFPASLMNCSNLQNLLLGFNYGRFGPLPKQIFNRLWKVEQLDLQFNNLTGELPSDFGNQTALLKRLILNNNNFIGSLPPQLGLLKNLQGATFQNNRFSGRIPEELGNCTNMLHLLANNNLLSGSIPSSLGRIGILELLALEHNLLSGSIPSSLSNCTRFTSLTLNYNFLEGNILPVEFPSMQAFDLSNNALSGPLPSELGSMTQVSIMDLSFNKLSGSVPSSLSNCVNLFYLNLSSNQLTGTIPAELGTSLKSLEALNLSHNFISGPIPSELANLTSLRVLDLAFNNLSDEIPDSLTSLAHLSFLNVSYNRLQGAIPSSGAFLLFTEASFLGNPRLCGSLLHIFCPSGASNSHGSARTIGLIVAASLLVLVLLTSFLVWILKHKAMPAEYIHSPFLRMTLKEIREATNNFSQDNILGSGGTSIVYKGTTKDGKTLAFKKMLASRSMPESSFFAEIKSVGQVRHRNLVKVLGYYSDLENDILIMDCMPNGNLSDYLHGGATVKGSTSSTVSTSSAGGHEDDQFSSSMSSVYGPGGQVVMAWKDRLEIAKGIAAGLAYLHHDCPSPIIHLDLKPTNILLDADMNPRISDFGLARVMQEAATHASTENIKGSFCYMAPEYASFGKVSKMCDVYSYGIVLLEIVTRRSPTNDIFDEGQTLSKWVQSQMQSGDKFHEMFIRLCMDTQDYSNAEREQVNLLLNVAMLCIKEHPNERPTMKEVIEHLEGTNYAGFHISKPFEKMIEETILVENPQRVVHSV